MKTESGADAAKRKKIADLTIQMAIKNEELSKLTRQLKEEKRRTEIIFDVCPVGLLLVHEGGRIGRLNRKAGEYFGYDPNELIGQKIEILVPEASRETHVRQRDDYVANPVVRPMGTGRHLRGRRKDGSLFPVEIALIPIVEEEHVTILVTVLDITERVEAFDLVNASAYRASLVGHVAEYVAHQINNPLAAMKFQLALCRSTVEDSSAQEAAVTLLAEQVDRISQSVRTMLGFARQRESSVSAIHLDELVRTISPLFEDILLAFGICVEIRGLDKLPPIEGWTEELQEVIINLFENAREALPNGGNILISGTSDADAVTIRFDDDGPGLGADPERVFTRFYTTKKTGTGLGLWIARDICERNGGSLDAENRASGGASFIIRIPHTK